MAAMGFIQAKQQRSSSASIIVPETFTHSIAFGQTGCGKTTGFIYPNLQNRMQLGHGILLYDYKGKEHLSVKFLAARLGRLDDVVEIGKPWGKSINFLQHMGENDIEIFFNHALKNSPENAFWFNSSKSLGHAIFKILTALEEIYEPLRTIDTEKELIQTKGYISISSFQYPATKTMKSLLEICSTHGELVKFIDNLETLVESIEELLIKQAKYTVKKLNSKAQKPHYKRLIRKLVALENTIEENKHSLRTFGGDSHEKLSQQILTSLTGPLGMLAQNEYFNTNSYDIIEALNSGKIVVLDMQGISEAIMENLNNVIMYELTKRTKRFNTIPTSIFIDEAQKVLSNEHELPVDILREAKVDIFLASQNSALLIEKISEQKYNALIGNLTHKYYFKNTKEQLIERAQELNTLESFEFVTSEDDYSRTQSALPIFITHAQKLKTEYIYQNTLGVLEHYLPTHKNERLVVQYFEKLYREGKVVTINIKNMEEKVVKYYNEKEEEDVANKIKELLEQIEPIEEMAFMDDTAERLDISFKCHTSISYDPHKVAKTMKEKNPNWKYSDFTIEHSKDYDEDGNSIHQLYLTVNIANKSIEEITMLMDMYADEEEKEYYLEELENIKKIA